MVERVTGTRWGRRYAGCLQVLIRLPIICRYIFETRQGGGVKHEHITSSAISQPLARWKMFLQICADGWKVWASWSSEVVNLGHGLKGKEGNQWVCPITSPRCRDRRNAGRREVSVCIFFSKDLLNSKRNVLSKRLTERKRISPLKGDFRCQGRPHIPFAHLWFAWSLGRSGAGCFVH